MLNKYKNIPNRQIDEVMAIKDIYSDKSAPLDLVIGELNGFHGTYKNSKNTKYYLIIEGNAVVKVDNNEYKVEKGDFILIPIGSIHSIEGNVKFAIICTPPFDRSCEVKFN